MILYVNGDSNTAGGEAVNDYCFAEDDPKLWRLGRAPHPDNLAVSWGQKLADKLGYELHCDAESASSNKRIHRTAHRYLASHKPDLLIIGWSTWERDEWYDTDTQRHWQINAGGVGHDWPEHFKERYKRWIVEHDYKTAMARNHISIHNYHKRLTELGINHYFFTCYEPFSNLGEVGELNWNHCYLEPYNPDFTYFNWCKHQGFKTTKPGGYHYGADAHSAWADFLYTKIVDSCLTKK